jgi:metal-responsive CopG/Arc/MetJ family transcriptional regulator
MSNIVKVAVSLPDDLLAAADEERKKQGETRSGFFRRAVELLLRREREAQAEERYIRNYRDDPESDADWPPWPNTQRPAER